jgi:hypothetical protein
LVSSQRPKESRFISGKPVSDCVGEQVGAQERVTDTHTSQGIAMIRGVADKRPSSAETLTIEVRQLRCPFER